MQHTPSLIGLEQQLHTGQFSNGQATSKHSSMNINPTVTRKILGGASCAIGVWATYWVLSSAVRKFWREGFEMEDVLLLPVFAAAAIPGVLAIVSGIRLFQSMHEESLRWVMRIFAVISAIILYSLCSMCVSPLMIAMDLRIASCLFLSCLAVIPLHVLTLRFLLRHLTGTSPPTPFLVSRGLVMLTAWMLYRFLSAVRDELGPFEEVPPHLPKEPWLMLGTFAPMIIAYTFYRIVIGRLGKARRVAAAGPRTDPDFRLSP